MKKPIVNAKTGKPVTREEVAKRFEPFTDIELIKAIADRAVREYRQYEFIKADEVKHMRSIVHMELHLVHTSIRPLRLQQLLEARLLDFVHDISGIHRHIDIKTQTLTDCFVPRYAA